MHLGVEGAVDGEIVEVLALLGDIGIEFGCPGEGGESTVERG